MRNNSLFETGIPKIPSNLLYDRFIAPPFSVLDTKQGYWQSRKRHWLDLGIKSELGRGDGLTFNIDRSDVRYSNKQPQMAFTRSSGLNTDEECASRYGRKPQQTSIFDPVLCEITYKWFSNDNAKILDPFGGGSVRGLIAQMLNRQYTGIDLNQNQVDANYEQYKDICERYTGFDKPNWVCGDSVNVKELTNGKYDLVFSCPPYYNLEVYSTDERDLSYIRTYNEFLVKYEQIIANCCELLNDDSFAVFVVGNLRNDTDGGYYDFSGDTIRAFQKAGLIFYNDGIIVNVAGTLPVRAPGQFNSTRKLGKQHQNYLVFYKGNPKHIKDKFGIYEEVVS